MAMVKPEGCRTLRPRPPAGPGGEREGGSEVKSPHQPKRVAAFMAAQMKSGLRRLRKSSRRVVRDGAAACVGNDRAGSSRPRRIQRVTNAGSKPAKKTARHPKRGNTQATMAAPSP